MILSAALPLTADESYYWVWSHLLSLSYFDHPPFISWIYLLGQPLEDFFSTVRWPGVLMGHLTLIVWIQILRPYLSVDRLLWFTVLALLTPLTGPGSLIITPDIPYLFFWSLLIWGLAQATPANAFRSSFFLGALLGLGFLSKYTVVIFVPLALAYFIMQKWPWRTLSSALVLATLVFAFCSLPVWIWNYQNDWISFGFQMKHGLSQSSWEALWPLEYLGGQILLLSPFVLYFALRSKGAPLWLQLAAWFPLLFFFITSFRGFPEANWPIASHLPVIALAVWSPPRFRWASGLSGLWGTLLIAALIVIWAAPTLAPKTKLRELHEFDAAIAFAQQHPNVYARSYQMASKISFSIKKPIFKLRGVSRFDFFDMHPESAPAAASFWLIASPDEIVPEEILQSYNKVESVVLDPRYQAWRFEKK